MKFSSRRFRFVLLAVVVSFSLIACQELKNQIKYKQAERAHNHGDYDKAIALYEELIAENSGNTFFEYNLGVAYVDKGDYEKAQAMIAKLRKDGDEEMAQQLSNVLSSSKQLKD